MIRGNGIADLRQGERHVYLFIIYWLRRANKLTFCRYVYMDLLLLFSLACSTSVGWLCISYDIACQFSKNFTTRLKRYPDSLQLLISAITFMRFVIPKFHMMAHGLACQAPFSLNFLPYSARVDGEGIERNWSHMDALAPSSREMTPAHRRETINSHYDSYNWSKIVAAGKSQLCSQKTSD